MAARIMQTCAWEPNEDVPDWLGDGIYFWEESDSRARQWAARLVVLRSEDVIEEPPPRAIAHDGEAGSPRRDRWEASQGRIPQPGARLSAMSTRQKCTTPVQAVSIDPAGLFRVVPRIEPSVEKRRDTLCGRMFIGMHGSPCQGEIGPP